MDPVIRSFTGPNRFLSNFWPSMVKAADGMELPTVEHAYQYEKFIGHWPTLKEPRELVKAAKTPGQAKKVAEACKHLLPTDWHDRKLDVMRRLLSQKFRQGSLLGKQLRDTGSVMLVEGNTWGDVYWGICKGHGENWLGRLLMEIRKGLQEDDA